MILLITFCIAALWMITEQLNVFSLHDFVEYWASGRLNLKGENPYSPEQMLKMEQTVGWNENEVLMMWDPPWTLPFVMSFGIFPYSISRFLWFLIQLSLIFWCAIILWKIYDGKKRYEWLALIVLYTFGPILHTLNFGQITVLVFLGCVGFLYFINKGSDFWAGVLASLVLIKPHLLYLFILAVIIWSFSNHRYRIFIGIATALIVSTWVSWLINPNLISQYIYAIKSYPPDYWMTATLGTFLRILFGAEKFYLQFIPSLVGGFWFLVYWLKNHKVWDWVNAFPLIILVSVATTSYGWTFDSAICVWAVIQITASFDFKHWSLPKILIFTSYWGVNLLNAFFSISQSWFWWISSFFLIWYLLSYNYLSRQKEALYKNRSAVAT